MAAHPEAAPKPGRGRGLLLLALFLTVAAAVPAAVGPVAVAGRSRPAPIMAPGPRVPPLWMPVAGAVVRGFDARAGPYGPGHRGVDIAAPVGEVVRAPGAGKVVFAGPVAGTTWVTILVAPGVTVTLGPLLAQVATGGRVRSSAPVGRAAPGHMVPPADRGGSAGRGGSGVGAAVHLSVRVDGEYVDPLLYLVDRPRARLVPLLPPEGRPGP